MRSPHHSYLSRRRNPEVMIKASIWFSVGINGLLALFFLSIDFFSAVVCAIISVLLIWYARTARSRIPYAATNLKCGITILKGNLGLGLVALSSMAGLLFYCFVWTWACFGTMQLDVMNGGQQGNWEPSSQGKIFLFLFLLSFYWTHQVLKNIVRTTVSGVVGTWWFSPAEAGSFCSAAVSESYVRATTYSLGRYAPRVVANPIFVFQISLLRKPIYVFPAASAASASAPSSSPSCRWRGTPSATRRTIATWESSGASPGASCGTLRGTRLSLWGLFFAHKTSSHLTSSSSLYPPHTLPPCRRPS